jgi:RNA polymerase sigma factor (sigma-70 family)
LYGATAERLLRFFARRVLDAQVSVDLVAETFAQAYASRRRFRGESDAEAEAWLFAIAHRQLQRYFREGVSRSRLTRALAGGIPMLTEVDFERIEALASLGPVREVLREQLGELDVGQRQALWLRVVEEQPYEVVARTLGVSQEAARKRVSRALLSLSASLAGERLEGGVS